MKTKNGYKLIETKKTKNGYVIALIDRGLNFCSFVVAWDYDITNDTWSQGHYYTEEKDARKKYKSYK